MKHLYTLGTVIIGLVALTSLVVAFSLFKKSSEPFVMVPQVASTSGELVWACNADAKRCPDGSSVGRTGPRCQFQECPSPDATFARIETYLGGRDGGLGLTINPRRIVSDSRCPQGAACVSAGTIEVSAAVETSVAHGEQVFRLGEPRTIGNLTVTLVEVRPSTSEGAKNPETGYWFVFEAKKQ